MLPTPTELKVTVSGAARAARITSPSVWYLLSLRTANTNGKRVSIVIVVKSSSGVYGSDLYKAGDTVLPPCIIRSV